jgi:hypothetical protein
VDPVTTLAVASVAVGAGLTARLATADRDMCRAKATGRDPAPHSLAHPTSSVGRAGDAGFSHRLAEPARAYGR